MTPRHAIALALAALAACSDKDLVARGGDARLRPADLEAARGGRGRPPDAAALEALVERTLLAEAARREGLLDDPALRARLEASAREIAAQALLERKLGGADREELLRARYASSRETLSRRRIHVAQIAFHAPPAGAERAAARSAASRASARLAAGESFEELARELSDDLATRGRDGDLGPLTEGQVDPAFFSAAAAVEPGKVSQPFETPFGVHLVKALEAPARVTPPFEEVRGLLSVAARAEATAALLAELRRKTRIQTWPERLPVAPPAARPAAAAAPGQSTGGGP